VLALCVCLMMAQRAETVLCVCFGVGDVGDQVAVVVCGRWWFGAAFLGFWVGYGVSSIGKEGCCVSCV
jgi:hypothetical protein